MMNTDKWFTKLSVENRGLYYKLTIIFSLFFLVPIAGFIYFAVKHDILSDDYIPFYFVTFLVFSFFGFTLLRRLFDEITHISRNISKTIAEEFPQAREVKAENELKDIFTSFQTLERELRNSIQQQEKKSSEISTLKELSELYYITFNTDDLLYITLERALKLSNADIGSVMILEKPKRDSFVVEATIGLGDFIRKGDHVNFADSIAKYAVINKAPLVVEDIETDIRFGRESRPQYATKSFVCMPLKTINEVIGVLTISRRKTEKPFTKEDVDILIPLISNAAFTYDNLRLLSESEDRSNQLKAMENLSSTINSSLRGSELFHAILHEMRRVVPYEMAIIMALDEDHKESLSIVDLLTFIPTNLTKGNVYRYSETVFSKVVKQQRSIMLHDTSDLYHPIEREIFLDHGFRNALLTPLKVEEKRTGILVLCNIQHHSLINVYKIIESMSEVLSRAMEKERLLFAFARRSQELETLRQIGSALAASTFDTQKVMQHTMDIIHVIMNVEAGSVLLLKGNELEFIMVFNINPDANVEILKENRLKLGEGIAGYSAARGEPIIVTNVKESRHFNPKFDRLTGFETKSVLCVPLISQGRVLGVIELMNKRLGEFNNNDLQLLQSIATTVSIAMENARLYMETLNMAENERGIRNIFQKFVPKEIVDKIVLGTTAEKAVIDEFKILTLLNIDIRGYSLLSQKVGPQKTVAILNYFFSVMGEIVFNHQGIVDKYLGDGFLAIFGAPVSSPVDADNAVSAALEMQRDMEHVNHYLQKRYGTSLTMGVSIHTGDAVVGNIGFDKKMDYTVIGDSVNYVFRLQSLCKSWPNCILISEKTYYASQSPLNVEEIGTYDAGNGPEKLKIYRVLNQ
ncbi:MAG: GAF domain-containing protein [Deltaproteobacteria bacterium]|nr:GAF domain-containing protein [Deltaproteobacteria bacterium]